jgi:hypothetical protein
VPLALFGLYLLRRPAAAARAQPYLQAKRAQLRADFPLFAGMFFFLLMSLGPYLIWLHPVTLGGGRLVQLPGYWLFQLPILSALKHVSRFGQMTLFLMLLAAMTQGRLLRRGMGPGAFLLTLALLAAHRADMQPFLGPVDLYRPPEALRRALTTNVPEGLAAALPPFQPMEEGAALYLQTLHGRTALYGYLSRQPKGALPRARALPFYRAMEALRQNPATPLSALPTVPSGKQKPALVLLIPASLQPAQRAALESALTQRYGYRKSYADSEVMLFSIAP